MTSCLDCITRLYCRVSVCCEVDMYHKTLQRKCPYWLLCHGYRSDRPSVLLVLHVSKITVTHTDWQELINFMAQATGLFLLRSALVCLMIFLVCYCLAAFVLLCPHSHVWVPVGVPLSPTQPTISTMKERASHRIYFQPVPCKIKHLNRHCHTWFIPCPRKSHQS